MGKRVLYISYDGMTDPLGQSQVLPYLRGLAEAGHQIIIVSAEKRNAFFTDRDIVKKFVVEHELGWYPVYYSNDWPFLSAYNTYRRLRKQCLTLEKEY